jgi:hypothetical protein
VKTPTKVIEVKEAPQMSKPAIQQGIRDKAAAQNWGEKNGYSTVYFMARKQKVYAEKLQVKPGDQQRGSQVLEPAATG